MRRRDLLTAGATGAAGLVAGSASAGTSSPELPPDPDAMERVIGRIDRRMKSFQEFDLGLPEDQATLARAALRTFYMTGVFTDLAERDRVHPGIQLRMRRLAGDADAAIDGLAGLFESMTPDDHRSLQERLQRQPNLAAEVGERFDAIAKEDGFGFFRRVDLRLAIGELGDRMRHQNPAVLIDPYARKVRRIQASLGGPEEMQRALAARIGEQAFWELQERNARHAAAWDAVYSTRPRVYLASIDDAYPAPAEAPANAPANAPAKAPAGADWPMALVNAGMVTLGVGAVLTGIGWLLLSVGGGGALSTPGLILGVTVGPIVVGVGLLILISGGIAYASVSR
jgi:hypothetical protein